MKRIMVIFGTRPEAIKMAPVIKALKDNENFETILTVTAQHRDMLDQVLHAFGIKPDFDLNIMQHSQTLTEITTRILTGLCDILEDQQPDFVLVHGDTSTTFAASLAAFYHRIPIGHVEAGLRTSNKYSPFPEEINRRLTGALADLHFAPTELAKSNLLNEGVSKKRIFVTGNTVIDALMQTVDNDYEFEDATIKKLDLEKPTILLTCHRRENIGTRMESIFEAVRKISRTHDDYQIVFPVHPNKKVSDPAKRFLSDFDNVHLIEPLGYKDMVNLMHRSRIVLTDSGGVQEESVALKIPVLILRDTTERSEAVVCGAAKLVGTQTHGIIEEVNALLLDHKAYQQIVDAPNPFGDGNASIKIVKTLIDYFSMR